MVKAGEWELCGSTGAGADQGLSCTQRRGNAIGSRWKCERNITLKSHALGCYISKNFYGTAREGQRTLVLCKSFC